MGRIKGDLLERSFDFALRIIELAESLPNRAVGWVIERQLLKSGTSIGANLCEANSAHTRREFAHICNIARREAAETNYWLRLISHAGLADASTLQHMLTESDELSRILATIVKKSRLD